MNIALVFCYGLIGSCVFILLFALYKEIEFRIWKKKIDKETMKRMDELYNEFTELTKGKDYDC